MSLYNRNLPAPQTHDTANFDSCLMLQNPQSRPNLSGRTGFCHRFAILHRNQRQTQAKIFRADPARSAAQRAAGRRNEVLLGFDFTSSAHVSFGGRMSRGCFRSATGKSFCQPDELSDFPDLFRERLTREFLPHCQFHIVGSFSLCRCRIFSNCVLSSPDCWSICSMRALSLARPTLAAMATMCSARKTFAGTPS